jgi:hypothetical protein
MLAVRSAPNAEGCRQERAHLLPPAEDGFPLEEVLYPLIVDGQGQVNGKGQLVFGGRCRRERECGLS